MTDVCELIEIRLGQDRGLVGPYYRLEITSEPLARRTPRRAELLDHRIVGSTSASQQHVDPRALEREIRGLQQILEAAADGLKILRIELLLLHEHLLAYAHFAEVVQQSRIPKLAQLLATELHLAVGP